MAPKKVMLVNRKAPHGSVYALESLEVALITAAFDQEVSLAFLDDGVYQLLKDQDTVELGRKNFSATYKALGDYEINKLYVEKESLEARGLTIDDLMPLTWEDEDDDYQEKSSIYLVERQAMAQLMAEQAVVLSF